MQALVYTGTNKIDFREEKDPIAKPGESIIKVKASGICGSDMHAYHGKDKRRIPPLILGHEFSGKSLDGKFKNTPPPNVQNNPSEQPDHNTIHQTTPTVQRKMRQNVIKVKAVGMKPSTRLYAFFDGVNVSGYVTPTNSNINKNFKT